MARLYQIRPSPAIVFCELRRSPDSHSLCSLSPSVLYTDALNEERSHH